MTAKYDLSGMWSFLDKIYVERRVQLRQEEAGCPVFLCLKERIQRVYEFKYGRINT